TSDGDVNVTADALSFANSTIGGGLTAQAGTITVNGATVEFNGSGTPPASLLAGSNLVLSNSAYFGSSSIPLDVTLSAGTGSVSIYGNSIVQTQGGDILIGGGGSVALPDGSSFSGGAPGG